MIARLTGTLVESAADHAVIDVNGVGYLILASSRTLSAIGGTGSQVTLYTELQVREDSMTLFAFGSAGERDWFRLLTGVQGVGGNIFGTDISFNVVPCIIQVTLADGSSYVNYATTALDFVGFYSTGAAISSISISAMPGMPGGGDVYPTANNLYFAAVPAPGAIALLGVAGLVGGRRRRD